MTFAVTHLGMEDMILGLPWLCEHNPEVDWEKGEVKMSRCPQKYKRYVEGVQEDKAEMHRKAHCICACHMGPFPKPTVEEVIEEDNEEEGEDVQEERKTVADGDRVFMTTLKPEEHNIRATGNFSQRLAKAHYHNSGAKTFRDAVPDYLHDFEDIFAEESYETLPERKQWDHAIELRDHSFI